MVVWSDVLKTPALRKRLGHRLRVLRHCREWELGDLAERTGLDRDYLDDLECGLEVSLDELPRVARVYDLTLAELADEGEWALVRVVMGGV